MLDVKPQAPSRSHEQRMAALVWANEVRMARAKLKRELRYSPMDVIDVIYEPPEWAETMKLIDVLLALPKFGRVKVNKIMVREQISASKTLGGLSKRQRDAILRAVSRHV